MIKKNKKGKALKFIDNKSLQNLLPRRQLLPKVYYRNDFVYLSRVNNIISRKPNIYGKNPILLISENKRLDIDINTEKDWIVAQMLFKHQV